MFGTITYEELEAMTDEELEAVVSTGQYWDAEHAREKRNTRTVARQRRGRNVGDVIEFVRFGKPVENSRNHRDGTREDGMSVYLLDGDEIVFVGWCFGIAQRPAYRGQGRIMAWGSDGEPVVEVLGDVRRAKKLDLKG